MKKLMLTMLAGAALMFNSCTKAGPQGPQGPAGADGNANVIGSNKQITISNWIQNTGNYYTADIQDLDITSDIVNTGVVEVFKDYPTSGWTNLPDINGITSTVFNFYTGGFTIYVQNSDGSLPGNPGYVTFRDVIISASQRQSHPNTNWKNYNEAMAALNSAAPAVSQ